MTVADPGPCHRVSRDPWGFCLGRLPCSRFAGTVERGGSVLFRGSYGLHMYLPGPPAPVWYAFGTLSTHARRGASIWVLAVHGGSAERGASKAMGDALRITHLPLSFEKHGHSPAQAGVVSTTKRNLQRPRRLTRGCPRITVLSETAYGVRGSSRWLGPSVQVSGNPVAEPGWMGSVVIQRRPRRWATYPWAATGRRGPTSRTLAWCLRGRNQGNQDSGLVPPTVLIHGPHPCCQPGMPISM